MNGTPCALNAAATGYVGRRPAVLRRRARRRVRRAVSGPRDARDDHLRAVAVFEERHEVGERAVVGVHVELAAPEARDAVVEDVAGGSGRSRRRGRVRHAFRLALGRMTRAPALRGIGGAGHRPQREPVARDRRGYLRQAVRLRGNARHHRRARGDDPDGGCVLAAPLHHQVRHVRRRRRGRAKSKPVRHVDRGAGRSPRLWTGGHVADGTRGGRGRPGTELCEVLGRHLVARQMPALGRGGGRHGRVPGG